MKTLPAGKYFIGDCSYVLKGNIDDLWERFCKQFLKDGENIVMDGLQLVAYDTMETGCGNYLSNCGATLLVRAGLIGCIPHTLWKRDDKPFGCLFVNFEEDFCCMQPKAGVLQFGDIIVDTRRKEVKINY